MFELRIQLQRHGIAVRAQGRGQIDRILRPHRVVRRAVNQQHGRRAGMREVNRLGLRILFGRPEHILGVGIRQRQEIIRSREPDDARNVRHRSAGGLQVARIEGDQCRQMRARRMPHQEQARRVRTIVRRVSRGPVHGLRRVRHEAGQFHVGVVAVVRQHRHIPQASAHRTRTPPAGGGGRRGRRARRHPAYVLHRPPGRRLYRRAAYSRRMRRARSRRETRRASTLP